MGTYQAKFERMHYRVNVETADGGVPLTEATVKLTVKGQLEHVVGEGDGPVWPKRCTLNAYLVIIAAPVSDAMHVDIGGDEWLPGTSSV